MANNPLISKKEPAKIIDRRLAVAPMLDWTDRHERFFLRLISKRTLLYSEMLTSGAVVHGDREHLLGYDPSEHPLALQLGGSDPTEMAAAAKIGESYGYDEININVGCPSDRVQSGRFGACLMAEPVLVAELVREMRDAIDVPVTVKHRIGIDDKDSWQELCEFVGTVAEAGCEVFIVHARKAWLQGLSPKQNREVPPLEYEKVFRLKEKFPDTTFILNGGIMDLDQSLELLAKVDGVMLGRAVYQNPWLLVDADERVFGIQSRPESRFAVMEKYLEYMQLRLKKGVKCSSLTRHILGLFQGQPGAKIWRRHLSENSHKPDAGVALVREALEKVAQAQNCRRAA